MARMHEGWSPEGESREGEGRETSAEDREKRDAKRAELLLGELKNANEKFLAEFGKKLTKKERARLEQIQEDAVQVDSLMGMAVEEVARAAAVAHKGEFADGERAEKVREALNRAHVALYEGGTPATEVQKEIRKILLDSLNEAESGTVTVREVSGESASEESSEDAEGDEKLDLPDATDENLIEKKLDLPDATDDNVLLGGAEALSVGESITTGDLEVEAERLKSENEPEIDTPIDLPNAEDSNLFEGGKHDASLDPAPDVFGGDGEVPFDLDSSEPAEPDAEPEDGSEADEEQGLDDDEAGRLPRGHRVSEDRLTDREKAGMTALSAESTGAREIDFGEPESGSKTGGSALEVGDYKPRKEVKASKAQEVPKIDLFLMDEDLNEGRSSSKKKKAASSPFLSKGDIHEMPKTPPAAFDEGDIELPETGIGGFFARLFRRKGPKKPKKLQ